MRKFGVFAAALCAVLFAVPASAASLVAKIDLSTQRMHVFVNGVERYTWAVSTARRGYVTPTGSYSVKRLERMWHSTKYDNAPMPHSVFFHGGYAVHGTYAVGSLGRPASHGCVRLAPGNAAKLYSMVQQYGYGNSRIVVTR
jgi:lipoprotein-anchoring transpeptidase ErfK/SrfK